MMVTCKSTHNQANIFSSCPVLCQSFPPSIQRNVISILAKWKKGLKNVVGGWVKESLQKSVPSPFTYSQYELCFILIYSRFRFW